MTFLSYSRGIVHELADGEEGRELIESPHHAKPRADFTTADKAAAVREYAAYCNGTNEYHRHWMGKLNYTDGVLDLAEVCGAHWLVDVIASWQQLIRKRHGADLAGFQVWRVESRPTTAAPRRWRVAAWSDVPGASSSKLLAEQVIPYSDFPPELSPYDGLWVEGGVLLLKAEH